MKFYVVLTLVLTTYILSAQNHTEAFYEHYTGLISDELKITADLIKTKNSFSGFYYYEYEEDGLWISSNPIALDGQVSEDGDFVLNEFGGSSSYFRGVLENPKLIKGVWVNEMLKEDVEFTIKATYPKGSINLNVVEKQQTTYFQQNRENPGADIRLTLLFPDYQMDQVVYHQLLSRIYYYLGYRGDISDKANILSKLCEKYDQQFQNSLSNVVLDSFPDSFDWEKSIRMDVINNESGLLCLQFETYARSGVWDGSLVRKYLIFDINQNKVVKLKDLFGESDLPGIKKIIDKKLREQYRLGENEPLTDFGFFNDSIEPTNNFYIHPGGIGFFYNVYEIAPFSNGTTDLFIQWSELSLEGEALNKYKYLFIR